MKILILASVQFCSNRWLLSIVDDHCEQYYFYVVADIPTRRGGLHSDWGECDWVQQWLQILHRHWKQVIGRAGNRCKGSPFVRVSRLNRALWGGQNACQGGFWHLIWKQLNFSKNEQYCLDGDLVFVSNDLHLNTSWIWIFAAALPRQKWIEKYYSFDVNPKIWVGQLILPIVFITTK